MVLLIDGTPATAVAARMQELGLATIRPPEPIVRQPLRPGRPRLYANEEESRAAENAARRFKYRLDPSPKRERQRAYYWRNPERSRALVRAAQLRYRKRNPERARARNRAAMQRLRARRRLEAQAKAA